MAEHAKGSRRIRDGECHITCGHVPSITDLGPLLRCNGDSAIRKPRRENEWFVPLGIDFGYRDVASDTCGSSLPHSGPYEFSLPGLTAFENPGVSQSLVAKLH